MDKNFVGKADLVYPILMSKGWNEIKLWGLFDWKYIEKYLKSGELLAPGYTKENKTVWAYPSQKTWEEKIKPLIDQYSIDALTRLAGW